MSVCAAEPNFTNDVQLQVIGHICHCELSKRLRARAAQAERISQTIGNLAATRTLKALAEQYEAQAETLEQAESLIANVS